MELEIKRQKATGDALLLDKMSKKQKERHLNEILKALESNTKTKIPNTSMGQELYVYQAYQIVLAESYKKLVVNKSPQIKLPSTHKTKRKKKVKTSTALTKELYVVIDLNHASGVVFDKAEDNPKKKHFKGSHGKFWACLSFICRG